MTELERARAMLATFMRRPIFLAWLRECRGAFVALAAHLVFMTLILGPLVRLAVPKPRGPVILGLELPSGEPDAYEDVMAWVDPIFWIAGWSFVGVLIRRRSAPTLGRLRQETLVVTEAPATMKVARRAGKRTLGPEGRLVLGAELGRGAMGAVYVAEDVVLGRKVAVKELTTLDADQQVRFQREGRVMAQLQSPHAVAVYDLLREGGRVYLCMELCEGGDLYGRLRTRGPLPLQEAVVTCRQIAQALVAAHAQGIVHRDLKPSNILFTADGTLKVADFGLARLADSKLTHDGTVMGTPAYMSPEQCLGKTVDARSDLYALGCILFELVAGRPPYRGAVLEVLAQHTNAEPPPSLGAQRPDAPASLVSLSAALLHKRPDERPNNATQVVSALVALEAELSALVAQPGGR